MTRPREDGGVAFVVAGGWRTLNCRVRWTQCVGTCSWTSWRRLTSRFGTCNDISIALPAGTPPQMALDVCSEPSFFIAPEGVNTGSNPLGVMYLCERESGYRAPASRHLRRVRLGRQARPAFACAALCAYSADQLLNPGRWRFRHLRSGRCPWCRYDIRGLAEERCPECGKSWLRTSPFVSLTD